MEKGQEKKVEEGGVEEEEGLLRITEPKETDKPITRDQWEPYHTTGGEGM